MKCENRRQVKRGGWEGEIRLSLSSSFVWHSEQAQLTDDTSKRLNLRPY